MSFERRFASAFASVPQIQKARRMSYRSTKSRFYLFAVGLVLCAAPAFGQGQKLPVDLTLPEGEAAAEPDGAADGEAAGAAPAETPADRPSPDADTAASTDDQDQQELQA